MRILFTGGGTAGHVTPNLPLIRRFLARDWQVDYIGSGSELERSLVSETEAVYHQIKTGKLRRYLTLANLRDCLFVMVGLVQAWWILLRLKPQVVFSKGGYVAFPVVVAAWLHRIPVIAHESDLSPGLANRLSSPFVRRICTTFPDTNKSFAAAKVVCTGAPVRPELLTGVAARGRAHCDFSAERPVLLVTSGSQGSRQINQVLREALPGLLETFQVVHLCGANHLSGEHQDLAGYRQFEFLQHELGDVLAATDLVVSRAGSNTLVELLALGLPNLLIPLGTTASRGDQLENAAMSERNGWSLVLREEDLTADTLVARLDELYEARDAWRAALGSFKLQNAVDLIEQLLIQYARPP